MASHPARERFAGSVWASGRFTVNQRTWLYGCCRRERDLPYARSCKGGTPLGSSGKLTGKWWSLFIFLTKSFQLPLPLLCLRDRWAGYRSLAPGFGSLQTRWFYRPFAYVILSSQIVERWKRLKNPLQNGLSAAHFLPRSSHFLTPCSHITITLMRQIFQAFLSSKTAARFPTPDRPSCSQKWQQSWRTCLLVQEDAQLTIMFPRSFKSVATR